MTERQPKGTPVGGQFAQGRKPDGSDLAPDRNDVDLNEEIEENIEFVATHPDHETQIKEHQSRINDIDSQRETRHGNGEFDADEDGADSEAMFWESQKIVDIQSEMIEGLQARVAELEKRTRGFNLNEAIRNDILDQVYDDTVSEEQLRSEVSPVIDRYFEEHDPGDIKGLYDLRNGEADYFFHWADANGYELPRYDGD